MGQVTSPSAFRLSPSSLSFLLHPFLLAPDVPLTSLRSSSHQQELVNLLLTGKAVSNVFNDVVELDSGDGDVTLLKGIAARSDIGFLSLFEHYNVCQVPGPRRRSAGEGECAPSSQSWGELGSTSQKVWEELQLPCLQLRARNSQPEPADTMSWERLFERDFWGFIL